MLCSTLARHCQLDPLQAVCPCIQVSALSTAWLPDIWPSSAVSFQFAEFHFAKKRRNFNSPNSKLPNSISPNSNSRVRVRVRQFGIRRLEIRRIEIWRNGFRQNGKEILRTYLQHRRSPASVICHGQLDVPRVRLSTYGGRAFCHAGPSAWNALPDFLKNDALSLSTFRRQLKHFYFSLYVTSQHTFFCVFIISVFLMGFCLIQIKID